MKSWSERALVLVIVAAIAAGIGFDLVVSDVSVSRGPSVAAEPTFRSRAVFCPPPFSRSKSTTTIVTEAEPGRDVTVGVEPGAADGVRLRADRILLRKVDGPAIQVVGYGGRVHAAALLTATKPVTGADAAKCPGSASPRWYFPEGSSALGYDERILIRNPFPDEAVVTVNFFTPDGKITRANLGQVAVSAGESAFVKVNDFVAEQPVLGASVEAERGRVVAWRALFAAPEDRPGGVQYSTGAPRPALEWFLPEGVVGSGLREEIALLNPNERESIVTVSLLTAKQTVQPPKLVDVRVPPQTLKTLDLTDVLGPRDQDLGAIGAVVRSTNEVGVIAERTVWYAAGRTGVASELGASSTSRDWIVPPAATAASEDSLVLLNPNAGATRVRVTLIRAEGPPISPSGFRDLKVKGGTRRRLLLTDFTNGVPMAVVVTADDPVAAERVASSANGDVAAVMGEAFTPTEP